MMYLLDTHTLLWFLRDDSRLSSTARSIIMDARSTTQASCISLWEIALKKVLASSGLITPLQTSFNYVTNHPLRCWVLAPMS